MNLKTHRPLLRRLAAGWLLGLGVAQAEPTAYDFTLTVEQNLLSLEADAVPVTAVLERLAEALAVTVDSEQIDPKPVTLRFQRLPLRKALDRLIDNYSLGYENGRLSEIRVLPSTTRGSATVTVQKPPVVIRESGPSFEFELDPGALVR